MDVLEKVHQHDLELQKIDLKVKATFDKLDNTIIHLDSSIVKLNSAVDKINDNIFGGGDNLPLLSRVSSLETQSAFHNDSIKKMLEKEDDWTMRIVYISFLILMFILLFGIVVGVDYCVNGNFTKWIVGLFK